MRFKLLFIRAIFPDIILNIFIVNYANNVFTNTNITHNYSLSPAIDYVVVVCYLFVSRVGHKQCAVVASDRALGAPARLLATSSASVSETKKNPFGFILFSEMVSRVGLEPTTPSLRGSCSNQLSYRPSPTFPAFI